VEQIKAFRDTWELGIHSYLTYLRDRLQIARELLTETGSIFLQISDENLHLVRSLMDEVFGSENAIATIPFRKKTMPFGTTYVEQMADFIVWYAKSSYVNGRPNAKYRKLYRSDPSVAGYNWVDLPDGNRMSVTEAVRTFGSVPEGSRYFTSKSLEPSGPMQSGMFRPVFEGKEYSYPRNGYGTTPEGLERLAAARRLIPAGNLLRYVLYADDKPLGDLTVPWMDTVGADDKRYVVQTNTRVVERCMLMTTDPGDLVLDPTCGSGTTAMVAEKWGRRWITVDTSRVALMVARQRLATAVHPSFELAQEATNAGQATDPRVGFRYRTVPHVTLKSIASNENIRPGMTASQVSEAIAKTADTETLYDQPLARSGVVRVTGPFTVETQAPHLEMSLARESAPDKEQAFVQGVLDNLRTSGVQSGVRDRRIEFTSSETVAGRFLVAEMRGTTTASNSARVAVSIGPRYGVVGSDWVKGAAREALAGVGYDMLLVLGFAFDPFAAETASAVSSSSKAAFQAQGEKRIGDMPVLLVRMNADLAMGQDLLRKSKNANLFTMFGEPDCTVQQEAGGWVVEVNGFDIYNPVSGEIESGDASNIAMWLLDTDYDGQSFCVRQLHFPGQTAYQKLSRALKAEIDPHEWQGYAGTRSRHFPDPSNGRIAIKIINDYGDEILTTRDLRRT
jgi:adenine-specific DNA-methyltransferase